MDFLEYLNNEDYLNIDEENETDDDFIALAVLPPPSPPTLRIAMYQ